MVGKVTVRSQGPVRRKQTTTTFKKGGRVKLMGGGSPSEMQMMTPRERAEYKMNAKKKMTGMFDRSSRQGGMTSGAKKVKPAKKYAKGGAVKGGARKVGEYIKDVSDATKKMSPHQDPRSERSSKMRHSFDNLKTSKKSPSPHSPDKKKKMGPPGKRKPATGMKRMPKRKNN